MSLHHESAFEREICEHLGTNSWIYEEGAAAADNRELALYPPDLIAWVRQAQPDAWEVLQKNHGSKAEATQLQRVRQQLDQLGTLDLLRQGVEVLGLPKALKVAEFKPAFGLNPQILARANANRLRVVRQLRYSTRNQNFLDLVLFLNGIPVATAERKTDNTQNIADAVWQYQTDRRPKAAGQAPEPLLSFPSGALVHFAVSNREVTARLPPLPPAGRHPAASQGRAGQRPRAALPDPALRRLRQNRLDRLERPPARRSPRRR